MNYGSNQPPTKLQAVAVLGNLITQLGCCACVAVVALLFVVGMFLPSATGPYLHAGGHLKKGVVVYYGTPPDKVDQLGTVEDFAYDVPGTKRGRGVLINRSDGKQVWFDREQLIGGDVYWVHKDDPADK